MRNLLELRIDRTGMMCHGERSGFGYIKVEMKKLFSLLWCWDEGVSRWYGRSKEMGTIKVKFLFADFTQV